MIRVAAAIISNDDGKVLLVRKCGTEVFMQPGGKIEAGEDELTTLEREVQEELGCRVKEARFVGRFQAPAANEPGQTVEASLYRVSVNGPIVGQSEIAEIIWVDPFSPRRDDGSPIILAPLTRDHVLGGPMNAVRLVCYANPAAIYECRRGRNFVRYPSSGSRPPEPARR